MMLVTEIAGDENNESNNENPIDLYILLKC